MNYIKMSPIIGMSGYGGGSSALPFTGVGTIPIVNGGDRAFTAGGADSGGNLSEIEFVTISSPGNAADFGDLTGNKAYGSGCANATGRALFWGFVQNQPQIDYITTTSTSNASDFGDMQNNRGLGAAASSGTRGLFFGGRGGGTGGYNSNEVDYVTIANTGNGTDFGNLTNPVEAFCGTGNADRSLTFGGYDHDNGQTKRGNIDYFDPSSTGNASDFGDMVTGGRIQSFATADAVRAVVAGGDRPVAGMVNEIEYVTISTTGNSTDFGDLTESMKFSACSANDTTAVFISGWKANGSGHDEIDYITIQTTGNAGDFGDALTDRNAAAGASSKGA